jgi:hypothetical protein
MNTLRAFEKVDWYGWAGAEDAPGKPPMICEGVNWVGVCDVNGVDVYIENENPDELGNGWYLRLTEYRYPLGKFILESLPEVITIQFVEDLGFVGV